MLKKFYFKKLVTCILVILTFTLLYILPNNKLEPEETISYVNKEVKTHPIYLLDPNGRLAKTDIIVNSKNDKDLALELINALIIDGNMQDKIPSGFNSIIPSLTTINDIKITDGLIKINFNEYLLDSKDEEKIIESIVYTLTSIDNINKVMIFINGEVLTTLPKLNKTLPTTLDRSFGINKEYNITSKDNINKTTIYYISKFNNNLYYVPVTKVNNDNRSKIEIIVDELTSSKSYNTNLMSFLDSNTKIVSFEEDNDKLNIEFNEAIFNDIDTNEILEEVIYTICLSISDNYSNIDKVSFYVKENEIYKSVLKTIE